MPLNEAQIKTYFTADNSKLKKGVEEAKSSINSLNTAVGKFKKVLVSAFSVAAVFKFGDAILSLAGQYGDLADEAKKFNTEASLFLRLKRSAEDAGVSIEQLQSASERLRVTIGKALGGDNTSINALKAFNLTAKDFIGLNLEQRFVKLGEAYKKISGSDKQAAALRDLLGRSGGQLTGLLNAGFEGQSGITSKQIDALDELDDNIRHVRESFQDLVAGFAADTAEAIDILRGKRANKQDMTSVLVGRRDVTGGALNTTAIKNLQGIVDSTRFFSGAAGVGGDLGEFGKNIIGLSDGMQKLTDRVTQAADAIKNNFVDASTKIIDDYKTKLGTIDNYLGNNDTSYLSMAAANNSSLKQIQSNEFNQGVRDVLEYAKTPGAKQSEIKRKLEDLKTQSTQDLVDQGYSWTDRNTYAQVATNSGQQQAIKQLTNLLLDNQKAPVQVNVKIEADADGVFRAVVTNPNYSDTTSAVVKNVMAKEARGVSR